MQSRDAEVAVTGSAGIAIAIAVLGVALGEHLVFYTGLGAGLMGLSYALVEEWLTRRAAATGREEAPHPDG